MPGGYGLYKYESAEGFARADGVSLLDMQKAEWSMAPIGRPRWLC